MQFLMNEEQVMIQQMAQDFLAEKTPFAHMEAHDDQPSTHYRANWQASSEQMSWQAALIEEEHGGLGLGMVELVLIFEKIGEKMWLSPIFSNVGITTPLLQFSISTTLLTQYLPEIAAGTKVGTCPVPLQMHDPAQSPAELLTVTCTRTASGMQLQGDYPYVLDVGSADFIVLPARDVDTQTVRFFIVDLPHADVNITPQYMLDKTLDMSAVDVSGLTVSSAQELLFNDAEQAYTATLELAAVAHSAQMLGGMSALLEMTVDYCQNRSQFGQPISQFQAMKHKAADMLLQIESAKTAVYTAACRAQEFLGGTGHFSILQQAVSVAQSYLSEAFFSVASEAIQMHGAVGVTWEYHVHWYFKRAKLCATMFGDSTFHRERLVQLQLAQTVASNTPQ